MIDTHAHLNFEEFGSDTEEVIRKSFQSGVEKIIVASSNIKTSKQSTVLAEKENIFSTVGIHPEDVDEGSRFDEIRRLAGGEKVVAIGECGLDYSYIKDDINQRMARKKQRDLFEQNLSLAQDTGKPLVLHNRDSDDDFYSMIKSIKGKGVTHCFTGDWSFAEKILSLGLMISFTGIVTFPKTEKLLDVVKRVPLDQFMVETDCPYLAPVPYRGQRSEPWMVGEVIKKIAEVKGMSFEEIEEKTTLNAKEFFAI